MDINKAIRKQNSSYRRFVISMFFLFLLLPFSMFVSRQVSLFFLIYLVMIEIMVLICIGIKKGRNTLNYEVDTYRLKVEAGFPRKKLKLSCKKMYIIHAEGTKEDIKLILISKSKIRNRLIKPIDIDFLRQYPYAGYHYGRIKKNNPKEEYYYTVIKSGGYKKFLLLDDLYKTCTNAFFTEEAIEQIKIYRNSKV